MFLVPKEYRRPKNLGELIGIVQVWKRGHNFNELGFRGSWQDGIDIVVSDYNPNCRKEDRAIANPQRDGGVNFWGFMMKDSYRLEHFLQDVREHFPGINFHDIELHETVFRNEAVVCKAT